MSSSAAMPRDKPIPPYGIIVRGHLQINELTLRERNAMNGWLGFRPLEEAEAQRIGYPEDEIASECLKAGET